ncbi:MAG: helix-hairpin-helix domain-containing protein, partial [Thermoplasmata archaeon]
MPKKEHKESVKCPGCGHESPPDSKVCPNCSEQLPSEPEASATTGIEELMSVPGVGDAKAHVLYKAGYKTVKDLQQADLEELAGVKGIGDKLAAKIIEGAHSVPAQTNEGLADWLSGREDGLSDWLSGR